MKQKLIEIDGRLVSGPRLADLAGIPWSTVYQRLARGWSVQDAFGIPAKQKELPSTLEDRIASHRKKAAAHIAIANRLQAKLEAK